VKGNTDYICEDGEILETISESNVEELESIGGTGDMITGMISALIYAGTSSIEACHIAGRVNRKAGELSHPTPATKVKRELVFEMVEKWVLNKGASSIFTPCLES
jgi:NAD(P)H-hydrate repair Nnr-like enzyme with NAD(P)H-hydrate dehydratase domain